MWEKKGTRPGVLRCQHCPLTLAEGPCSGAQYEFERGADNALEMRLAPPLFGDKIE